MITTVSFGQFQTFDLFYSFVRYLEEFNRVKGTFFHGQYNDFEAFILYCMIRVLRPKQILEIGTGSGKTTSIMCAAATKNKEIDKIDFKIVSVDIENRALSLPNTTFIRCDSAKLKLDMIPDFLFYDAEHQDGENLLTIFGKDGTVKKYLDQKIPAHFHDIVIHERNFVLKNPALIGDLCGSTESKLVLDEIATGTYDVIFNTEMFLFYKKMWGFENFQLNPSVYLWKQNRSAVIGSDISNWDWSQYPYWSEICKKEWRKIQ